MNQRSPQIAWVKLFLIVVACGAISLAPAVAQDKGQTAACQVEPIDYRGWSAQQLSNKWVKLIVVPQNGGRLMQVTFAGHDYLFVNPELAGKHKPPTPP